jgi:hypothetical protein
VCSLADCDNILGSEILYILYWTDGLYSERIRFQCQIFLQGISHVFKGKDTIWGILHVNCGYFFVHSNYLIRRIFSSFYSLYVFSFYPHGATFPSRPGSPHCRDFTITLTPTYHTRWNSGRVISPTQRSLPNSTQHSQDTGIYAPSGIRTRISRKRAAADPRLGRRGDWDRLVRRYRTKIPDRCILNVILKGAFYWRLACICLLSAYWAL